jgi:hypothetical protein
MRIERHAKASTAGKRHLTRNSGTIVTAVDDEVVAFRFAPDSLVDRSFDKRIVRRRT